MRAEQKVEGGLRITWSTLFFLLLFLPISAAGQQPGKLLGRIVNVETGRGIQGAFVTPQPFGSSPQTRYEAQQTTRTGFYEIALPPGRYQVNVVLLGFVEVVDTVEVVS